MRSWLREVTIMGGSTTLGTVTPVAESNVHADPEAAAVVFESGVPIRMVGYDVTRQTGFDRDDIARLRESGRRTAAVIADLMSFYLDPAGAGLWPAGCADARRLCPRPVC